MATTRKPITRRPAPKTERKPARKPSTNGRRKPAESKPEVPAVAPPAESTPETERPPIKNPAEFDFGHKLPAMRAAIALYHEALATLRSLPEFNGGGAERLSNAESLLRFFRVTAIARVEDNDLTMTYYHDGKQVAKAVGDFPLASWMMEP